MHIYFPKDKTNLKTEIMWQILLVPRTHLNFFLLNENACSLPVTCS